MLQYTPDITEKELIEKFGETPESLAESKRVAEYIDATGQLPPTGKTVRRVGRPALSQGTLVSYTHKETPEIASLINETTEENGETLIEFFRQASLMLLQARGKLRPAT